MLRDLPTSARGTQTFHQVTRMRVTREKSPLDAHAGNDDSAAWSGKHMIPVREPTTVPLADSVLRSTPSSWLSHGTRSG